MCTLTLLIFMTILLLFYFCERCAVYDDLFVFIIFLLLLLLCIHFESCTYFFGVLFKCIDITDFVSFFFFLFCVFDLIQHLATMIPKHKSLMYICKYTHGDGYYVNREVKTRQRSGGEQNDKIEINLIQ